MGDEPQTALGGNAEAELKRRIDRRIDILDQVADLVEELKTFKAEDKADGFNERAISDTVRLKRVDAEKVLATLMYEAEREIYRKAAGLPVDIEAAQAVAQQHVNEVPEAKSKKRGGGR